MPVTQDCRPLGKVIDRVVAEEGVERLVREREPPPGIRHSERNERLQVLLPRALFGGLDSVGIDVDPDTRGAGLEGHATRDSTRSAGDLERGHSARQLKSAKELTCFRQSDPAGLSEVFVVGLPPDRDERLGREAAVVRVVEVDVAGHPGSVRQPRRGRCSGSSGRGWSDRTSPSTS